MADGYVSQVQLPNNETYDIKDKNAVKDITSSDIPGNINFTKGEETKDILVKDFGTAYGIDCYKGKFPLDFTSPGGAIDEWKIYGNSSGPTEVLETQSVLPTTITAHSGNAVDWEIYGNNNPVVENTTGDLPIEVSATASNAVDWTIYGNDENGTENLMQVIATSKTQNGITFTVDSNGRITINGNATAAASLYIDWVSDKASAVNVVEPSTTYTVSGGLHTTGVMLYWGTFNSDDTYTQSNVSTSATFTTGVTAEKSRAFIFVTSGTVCDNLVCEPMLVKGSTAPQSYIPHQKGVGGRTENELKLIDFSQIIAGVRFTIDGSNGTVTAKGQATSLALIKIGQITLSQGTYRVQGCPSGGSYNSYRIDVRTNATTLYQNTADYGDGAVFTVDTDNTTLEFYVRCAQNVDYDLTFYPLVKSGSGAINFIPYGYQIPLTVSQQGQTDKTVDIYIGDNPLTEGETVSKSSTGVDIELFSGDNIIDTTLYNKPNTSITYNSSVLGVGERTGNEFNVDIVQGYYNTTNGIFIPNSTRYVASGKVSIIGGQKYTLSFDCDKQASSATSADGFIYFWNNDMYINGTQFTNKELCTFTAPSDANTFAFIVGAGSGGELIPSDVTNIMLVKGSTVPTSYVPFGYQIPLLVTSGQQSTPHTIYIGDSPLTEGQSVSKASSGTDITLYQGENTISTTLGNKPEMRIDYLNTVVGVGERTKNLFDVSKVTDRVISGHTFLQVINNEIHIDLTASTSTPDGDNHTLRDLVGELELNTGYTLRASTTGSNKFIYLRGTDANFTWSFNYSKTFTTQESLDAALDAKVLWYASGVNTTAIISNIMIVKGSAAPTSYIPYGYQIPIDIKQGDEVVDHKDIYIGTQPLVEGDYINQTGVYRRLHQFVNYASSSSLPNYNFIPITEQLIAGNGENTITTSLVNNTTIDVELHPTKQASWICDRLEDLQRRIDNVDSTLGAPERRNYLVTWCSEDRLTGSTTNLDFSFNNKDSGYSTFLIDGKSTATSAFIETIDLLHMINGTAQPDSNNYTVARPGKYVIVIFRVEMEDSSSNTITLKIIRDNVVIASQQLINEYIGCIPFEIPNDIFGNNTIIQIEVNSTTGWTDLSFGAGIAVLNATMLLQDSNLKTDTMAIGNFSMYDSYVQLLRSHRSLESKCTILENKCAVLENEYDQLANESVKDIIVYSDYTSTIPSGLSIDISQYKNKIKYVDIYFTDNNYRKGEVYPYNILAENFGYLRIPYGQIYTGASADEATRLSLSLIGDENSYYIRRELFYVSTDYEQEHLFFSQYSSVPGLILQFVGTPTNEWSDFSVKGKASEVIKIYEVHLIVSP